MKQFKIIMVFCLLLNLSMPSVVLASDENVMELDDGRDITVTQNEESIDDIESVSDTMISENDLESIADTEEDIPYYTVTYVFLDGHTEKSTERADWFHEAPDLNPTLYYWSTSDKWSGIDDDERIGLREPFYVYGDTTLVQKVASGDPNACYTVTLVYDDGHSEKSTYNWGESFVLPENLPEGYWWSDSEESQWGLEGGRELYVTGDVEYHMCKRNERVIVEKPNPPINDVKTEFKAETKDIAAKDHSPKTGDEGTVMPVFLLLISAGTLLLGSKHMRQVSE